MADHTGKKPLHRAKIIARKAAKALVGEDGADTVPALAMLVVGTLQQHFHDIDDARAILQQIHDFEDDFLNDAFPGGVSPASVPAEPKEHDTVPPEVQDQISDGILEGNAA